MEKIHITIKIAGDSGDGIQLTGHLLAMIHALFGNDVATCADYPAEIRAPKGTIYGVSAYQLQISGQKIFTPGDDLDILVALNPAALKVSLKELKKGGTLIINEDAFNSENLKKISWQHHPLEDDTISQNYLIARLPMNQILHNLFSSSQLKKKEIERTKNFLVLGVICWLLSKEVSTSKSWVEKTFSHLPEVAEANIKALCEGYTAALVREMLPVLYTIPALATSASIETRFRFITGNTALALALVGASEKSQRDLFFSSYPITPASSIFQTLISYHHPQLKCFQAEDEIAAIGSAMGAAYGGALAAVATSGPGFCLMSEFLSLAVMAELPLVLLNIQRAGPSTGMPTKTEQGDLFLALWGRNGDAPVVVLAPHTPAQGFSCAYLACKIAIERTCAVVVLSDAYLAHGHEIWPLPSLEDLDPISSAPLPPPQDFKPYEHHQKTLARPWVQPGTPGYEHVIGGLEKTPEGGISYAGSNHQHMSYIRREKIERTAELLPPLKLEGDPKAKHLIISWGSTYGALKKFITQHRLSCQVEERMAHLQLLSLKPLQKELAAFLKDFAYLMVLEGGPFQALTLLRASFPQHYFQGIGKNDGRPWSQKELTDYLIPWLKATDKTSFTFEEKPGIFNG